MGVHRNLCGERCVQLVSKGFYVLANQGCSAVYLRRPYCKLTGVATIVHDRLKYAHARYALLRLELLRYAEVDNTFSLLQLMAQ